MSEPAGCVVNLTAIFFEIAVNNGQFVDGMQSLEGLVGTGLQKCDSVYELTGPHDLDGYFQKQKQTNKQKNKGSYKPTREYETSFKPLPSPTHLALPIPPSPTLCVQPPTLPPPNAASTDNKGR